MRERSIHGASRRKGLITTLRDRDARPAPDLVDRKFAADPPDQLWVADITYVPTLAGVLFVAIVLGVFSRRVVGLAVATHLRTHSCSMRSIRRFTNAGTRTSSTTPTKDVSTRRLHLATAAERPASGLRWDRLATATTTRCARASMRDATLECELLVRHRFQTSGGPFSLYSILSVGTTRSALTPGWTCFLRLTTRSGAWRRDL